MSVHQFATSANIAELLVDVVKDSEEFFLKFPPTASVAKPLFDFGIRQAHVGYEGPMPDSLRQGLSRLRRDSSRELFYASQDVVMLNLWEQSRIVYDIDPDAWESIGDARTDMVVPMDLLEQLPHTNPLMVFPQPVLLDNAEGDRQKVIAVFISGAQRVDSGLIVSSTHAPNVVAWNLTFAGLVEDAQGRPVTAKGGGFDIMWTRTTMIPGPGVTLAQITEQAINRFNPIQGKLAMGDHTKDLPTLIARAINMAIYLCARNADLQSIPAGPGGKAKQAKPGKQRKTKPLKRIAVGYRVGAKLREWKRAASTPSQGGGTGGTRSPHLRRSHYHTFKYGPGRQMSYIKWLWPIPVNMGLSGPKETTIIPLKDPRGEKS